MDPNGIFQVIQEEESNLQELLEERFVFYECVPTLQQIACHEVALKLWHHYVVLEKSKNTRKKTDDHLRMAYHLGQNYQNESNKLVAFLNIPRCVEEMLKKSLGTIRLEMEKWIRYCKEKMFKNGLMKFCVRDFNQNHCVWFQNDRIDYRRTASKMLTDAELTPAQKFVIMCLHGMADEIKKFPVATLPDYFHRRGFFDFEISYWISYYRNDVTSVLLELVSIMAEDEDVKINVIMASICANRCYPFAFEYFWSRLDEEEQISVALKVLPRTWQLQKNILSQMSLYQQNALMAEIPVVLMVNFSVKLDMPEYAYMIWSRVKNNISEYEFASLVRQIYDSMISSEHCIGILIDIWDTASDRLKNHVARTQMEIIFDTFLFSEERTPSSSKFLCKCLSLNSAQMRKQMILEDADLLAKYIDNPNFMIDVVELCLPNDSEKAEFKNLVMQSFVMRENCAKLINALEFDKLYRKLAFYSSNDRVTRELIAELMKSFEIDAEIFIFDHEKWNKLSNFILETFPNDLSTASRLKKQLILSYSNLAVFHWNQSNDFSEMVKVIEQEFSPVELVTFKQTLFRNFRKIIVSKQFRRSFNGKCFDKFVSWCLDDEKKVLEFKKIIAIDDIFDDIFSNICGWNVINGSCYEPHHLLDKLDEFLRCFCPNDEEVKKFKIRKMNELDRYSFSETWLNSDDRAWSKILSWFFENDQDEMERFQSSDSNDTSKRRKLNLMGCFR